MTPRKTRTTCLALLLVAVGCARREESPAQQAAAPEAAKPTVAAAADQRLRAMSATLANAGSFSFSTSQSHERVNAAGVKSAAQATSDVVVARPNRLWVKRNRDGATALAVYDGSTLSLQGDKEKVWSQVDMPPTIDEALDYAAEVYRYPQPVADFLYSDPYGSFIAKGDSSAQLAGQETVDGRACEKVAIQTGVVDALLWLEEGERALPCKLEIVYKELDQAPRSSIVFSNWNLAPTVDETLFRFSAPADYKRIPMVAEMSEAEERQVRERAKGATAPPTGAGDGSPSN